jgi:ataxin-10
MNSSGAYLSLVLHTYASQSYRRQAGEDPKLWTDLRKLWRDLARTQLSFWDNDDDSGDEEEEEDNENNSLRAACTKLAKFTRNLVAGVPENQLRA